MMKRSRIAKWQGEVGGRGTPWVSVFVMAGLASLTSAAWGAEPSPARGSDRVASTSAAVPEVRNAATPTTIWSVRRPDGSMEFRDTPPPLGIKARTQVYTETRSQEAQRRAEREREHWARQGEAFEQRRTSRIEAEARVRQAEIQAHAVANETRRWLGGGDAARMGWPVVVAPQPVHPVRVDPVYSSAPGAAQGRGGPFVGSGFGPSNYR